MKIGIFTLKPSTNFGCILQAYALQTVLERMGHNVVIVAMPYTLPVWKKPLCYAKRILGKYILMHKDQRVFVEKHNEAMNVVLMEHTGKFIRRYLHLFPIERTSQLKEDDFDAFVVGSDQIWRPGYFPKIEIVYLSFARKWTIKRLSYAASFGTDKWEYMAMQTRRCAKLLQQFDAVSVREDSGVELCKCHFNVSATHVLDPTLLLVAQDYIKLIQDNHTPKSNGNLLVYILDPNALKSEIVNRIAKEKGLHPFMANAKVQNESAPVEERIQLPVEQWLRGFYDAEFVVCDSFHGAVFSIIFNKPFVVIPNEGRGNARFHSLLKAFGLQDRLLIKTDLSTMLASDINWEKVNSRWKELQATSFKFLQEELLN